MVGHALAAFALVALVSRRRVEPARALTLGVVAGAFAATPDVDVLFALPGLVEGGLQVAAAGGVDGVGDLFTVTNAFWGASTAVHRSVTHSLAVAVPVAVAAGLLAGGRRRSVAVGLLVAPVLVAVAVGSPVEAAMLAVFGLVVGGVATALGRRVTLSVRTATTLAAVGLFTHPFGDLFTGDPPRLLYPLGVDLVGTRVTLFADPTLHLLAVFGFELVAAWVALLTVARVVAPSSRVHPVAVGGVGYALAGVVLVPPTLSSSYQFVFSVLAVGVVAATVTARPAGVTGRGDTAQPDGGTPETAEDGDRRWAWLLTSLLTATAAVTLAWTAYLVVYLAGLAPAG
jgi:hypothetical protein